jgi:hypothetical protein
MTNEDKLKIMKHDELVAFFRKSGGCPVKWQVAGCPCIGVPNDTDDVCLNCWSDWLKEDVEDE